MNAALESKISALVSRPEQRIWIEALPGEQVTFRVRGEDVGGAYAILEGALPPLSGPPLHTHENADEIFEVLEGSLRFVCEGDIFDAATGTIVVVPRGAQHTWKNVSSKDARVLVIFSPAGPEGMFEELGGATPEQIAEIAPRYSCRIVGPPL